MSIPIIRFTVENMRHEMQMALTSYIGQMDHDIQAAVEAAVSETNIEQLLLQEARTAIEWEVRSQMKAVIAQTVRKAFENDKIKTELESQVGTALFRLLSGDWLMGAS